MHIHEMDDSISIKRNYISRLLIRVGLSHLLKYFRQSRDLLASLFMPISLHPVRYTSCSITDDWSGLDIAAPGCCCYSCCGRL